MSVLRKLGRSVLGSLPKKVSIVEVSPRDGLQNEAILVPTHKKLALISKLSLLKFHAIEVTSFVSPKWVPQMADNESIVKGAREIKLKNDPQGKTRYQVLCPNLKGFEGVLASGAEEISIFGAASETFSQKNINCSIEESLKRFEPICESAKKHNIPVRGYVSTALGCPYEGAVPPSRVTYVAQRLLELGCYQVSIGDTIGTGTIGSTDKLFNDLVSKIDPNVLALHFHDTYGQALANLTIGMLHGVSVIDSSVAGVGGCPYAKGASGNVATEDVLYMLKDLEVDCDVPLEGAIEAGEFIAGVLNKPSNSKAAKACRANGQICPPTPGQKKSQENPQ